MTRRRDSDQVEIDHIHLRFTGTRAVSVNRFTPASREFMSEKKPVPIVDSGNRKTCPVCGERSYSREGIHPQCAVKLADADRTEEIKARRKRETTGTETSAWNKKACPMCKLVLHVRQKVCQCGHVFF